MHVIDQQIHSKIQVINQTMQVIDIKIASHRPKSSDQPTKKIQVIPKKKKNIQVKSPKNTSNLAKKCNL